MSNFWSAVKQIRSEKRFRNAPAPLDALAARVRQLSKDLNLLRRAMRDNKLVVDSINNILAHNSKLPADVDKVARWCERLVGPFILYIEAYTNCTRPESLSSLLKAPFAFLEEIKELLQELEKFTSKGCGVSAISALLAASRRMLTLQSSQESSNDFEFNSVRSFSTGHGVSAAFNPVDVMERALFDATIGEAPEFIAELLLIQSHGSKSIAICAVREQGPRSLLFPPFRGQELDLKISDSIVLSQADRSITLNAAPYVIDHWTPLLQEFFSRAQAPSAPVEVTGLGIAFGKAEIEQDDLVQGEEETSPFSYDKRNREEKFGDEFENFDESFDTGRHSIITKSESLNALKRISVGMPMDFSEDLAKILKGIEEEEDTPRMDEDVQRSSPAPPTQPVPRAPFTVTTNIPQATAKSNTSLPLPAPTAPFARGTSIRSRGTGSPCSFFSATSEFSNSSPSSASSPRTLDEAEALRRRISLRISAREQKDQKERGYNGTPLTTHTTDSISSLTSIMLSDASSVNRSATCLAKTESLRTNTPSEPSAPHPPSIPAPVFGGEGVVQEAQKATVVRVSMPKRINFGVDENVPKVTANDLSTVPQSPVPQSSSVNIAIAPVQKQPARIGNPDFAASTPAFAPAVPRVNAPVRPRAAVSMYSPKVGTPDISRSYSDEQDLAKQSQSSLVSVTSTAQPQPTIWFNEEAPKSSKVKAIAKFFKKKPKSPNPISPAFGNGNGSSSTVATVVPSVPHPPSFVPERAAPSIPTTDNDEPKIAPPAPPTVGVSSSGSSGSSSSLSTAESVHSQEAKDQLSQLPSSLSLNSSSSSSAHDLHEKLNNRASTIFYRNDPSPVRELFALPDVKSKETGAHHPEATAVCVDSHNDTIASNSFKVNSISSSLNTSQSYASIHSRNTISTANTSVGSTKAWSEFMNGVNINVARQQRDAEEEKNREAELRRKAEELERLEKEVNAKKEAIEKAASKVQELSLETLDPGNKVNRSVPILRQLYDEKEEHESTTTATTSGITSAVVPQTAQFKVYQTPAAFSSAPILSNGITPLVIRKPGASVTFSEPSTPTEPVNITFSGFMWVSRWTVNRWVPVSQNELPVEIQVTAEQDIISVSLPGSSRPIKLKYNTNCDVRLSNAHDVELRVKEDVYMFRCRSTQRCKKFYNAIEALQLDPQDPATFAARKLQDSDSSSGSTSSASSTGSRRCAPPKLAHQFSNKHSRTSVYPIVEE